MDERELNILIENELYKYILALSDDKIEKVTLERIEEGILYFLIQHEDVNKRQRKIIIEKIWKMFQNKNKNLLAISKEDYEKATDKIEGFEI